MVKIALSGNLFTQSVANNHIRYRKWEYQYTTATTCNGYDVDGNCNSWSGGDEVYGWNYYYTSANINGSVLSSITNVKIQGKSPIIKGDITKETDTYNIPSGGEYYSGKHVNISGTVTSGNSKNVYVNGKSVSIVGSSTNTHADTNTQISSGGSSSTVNIN